jgi:hypothetical protein
MWCGELVTVETGMGARRPVPCLLLPLLQRGLSMFQDQYIGAASLLFYENDVMVITYLHEIRSN